MTSRELQEMVDGTHPELNKRSAIERIARECFEAKRHLHEAVNIAELEGESDQLERLSALESDLDDRIAILAERNVR